MIFLGGGLTPNRSMAVVRKDTEIEGNRPQRVNHGAEVRVATGHAGLRRHRGGSHRKWEDT